MHKRLTALETAKSPFENPPRGADVQGVHWVRPQLVAEVSFAQWTKERVVRQAVFHGLRTDKPASTIGYEKAAALPRKTRSILPSRKSTAESAEVPVRQSRAKAAKQQRVLVGNVSISHPNRVIDPASADQARCRALL